MDTKKQQQQPRNPSHNNPSQKPDSSTQKPHQQQPNKPHNPSEKKPGSNW